MQHANLLVFLCRQWHSLVDKPVITAAVSELSLSGNGRPITLRLWEIHSFITTPVWTLQRPCIHTAPQLLQWIGTVRCRLEKSENSHEAVWSAPVVATRERDPFVSTYNHHTSGDCGFQLGTDVSSTVILSSEHVSDRCAALYLKHLKLTKSINTQGGNQMFPHP